MSNKTQRRRTRQQQQIDRRIWFLAGGAVILIAAALVIAYVARDSSAGADTVMAANFVLPGLDGENVALADFRGQYVLINFWASWCPPCTAEMPGLYAYHLAHQDAGFVLLGVNSGEDAATARRFMESGGYDFPVALDIAMHVGDLYRVDGLPSSFLIGPDGTLVKTWPAGIVSRTTLEQDITPLLNG